MHGRVAHATVAVRPRVQVARHAHDGSPITTPDPASEGSALVVRQCSVRAFARCVIGRLVQDLVDHFARRRRRRRGRGANVLRPRDVVVHHAPRPAAGAELGHRAQPPPIIGARFGRCRPRQPCRVACVTCVLRVANGGRPRQLAASRPHLPIGDGARTRPAGLVPGRPQADGHLGRTVGSRVGLWVALALHAYWRGQDVCCAWLISGSGAGVGHIVQVSGYGRRWRCCRARVCRDCNQQNVHVASCR